MVLNRKNLPNLKSIRFKVERIKKSIKSAERYHQMLFYLEVIICIKIVVVICHLVKLLVFSQTGRFVENILLTGLAYPKLKLIFIL